MTQYFDRSTQTISRRSSNPSHYSLFLLRYNYVNTRYTTRYKLVRIPSDSLSPLPSPSTVQLHVEPDIYNYVK